MVIERYLNGPEPVYQRAAASGRMLPDGLTYVDSWVAADGMDRCFQLMETDDPALFDAWTQRWSDLVAFEVVPVLTSAEAAARARGLAGRVLGGPAPSGVGGGLDRERVRLEVLAGHPAPGRGEERGRERLVDGGDVARAP
jgi:hypothetical protein